MTLNIDEILENWQNGPSPEEVEKILEYAKTSSDEELFFMFTEIAMKSITPQSRAALVDLNSKTFIRNGENAKISLHVANLYTTRPDLFS